MLVERFWCKVRRDSAISRRAYAYPGVARNGTTFATDAVIGFNPIPGTRDLGAALRFRRYQYWRGRSAVGNDED